MRRLVGSGIAVLALVAGLVAAPTARAAPDAFYTYSGSTPLGQLAPGTVLKTRTVSYHLLGIPVPLQVVQLLYRSTSQVGMATANVTSIVKPPIQLGPAKQVIAYQSFYDSLNPDDSPSRTIAGGLSLGGLIPDIETGLVVPELLQGRPVVIADTEGATADFAAGPEYGMNTLDSLRAALHSPAARLSPSAKIAIFGYSGGAIGTDWAAELAPTYAPDVNQHLIGASMGGVLADPDHNLHYIDGTPLWSAVMPMAFVGLARAFHVDLTPYLSDYGRALLPKVQNVSIIEAFALYAGQSWAKLAKPEYPTPESVPVFVQLANQLIMGTGGTPTIPMLIGQGANGILEGTPPSATVGAGDGVMVAGDVRTLARDYCARGVPVQYQQYDATSHVTSAPFWILATLAWLNDRFAGRSAPSSCGQIAPGNPLTPIPN
jgi:hypothetical protein